MVMALRMSRTMKPTKKYHSNRPCLVNLSFSLSMILQRLKLI